MPQVANLLFRKSPTLHRKSCFTHPPNSGGQVPKKLFLGNACIYADLHRKNQVANSHPLTWKLRWGVKYQKHFCYDSHGMCRSSEKNHFSSPKPIGVVVRGSSIKNILLGIVWTYTHVYISAFFILAPPTPNPILCRCRLETWFSRMICTFHAIPSKNIFGTWFHPMGVRVRNMIFLSRYVHFIEFLANNFLGTEPQIPSPGLEVKNMIFLCRPTYFRQFRAKKLF